MSRLRTIRRVAIIGAGPCGLAAAKYLLAEAYFSKIDIFEQRSRVGGVWIHSPLADKQKVKIPVPQLEADQPPEEPIWHETKNAVTHREAAFISALYSNMETNVPKKMMEFSEMAFHEESQLFPKFETVLEYLEEYADDIKYLIHFETQVRKVTLNDPTTGDWTIERLNLRTGNCAIDIYDAVVVANGHYSVPYLPAVRGIETWNQAYPDVISHSKLYDLPGAFHDKKVLLIGNSASALDIGSQISKVCRQPLLVSQRTGSYLSPGPHTDRIPHGEIAEFLPSTDYNRAVKFVDGSIEEDLDAILFCTGYLYSYPFLSSLDPPVFDSGARVLNVFQQMFYIEHPTLVFPGLPQRVVPFALSESQAAVFSRVWSGRLDIPSKEHMRAQEDSVIAIKGNGKQYHSLLYPLDADYMDFLYDWAKSAEPRKGLQHDGQGKLGFRWGEKERWIRQNFPAIKLAFNRKGDKRHSIRKIEELGFDFEVWKQDQAVHKVAETVVFNKQD